MCSTGTDPTGPENEKYFKIACLFFSRLDGAGLSRQLLTSPFRRKTSFSDYWILKIWLEIVLVAAFFTIPQTTSLQKKPSPPKKKKV